MSSILSVFNKDSLVLLLIISSKFLTIILGMVNLFLLQYYFGIATLGKYISVTSLVFGVSFPIALSLNAHFQRARAHNLPELINEYISSTSILGFICGLISYILLINIFHYEELEDKFWIFFLVVVFSSLFMVKHSLMGVLKANGKMVSLCVLEIIVPLLFLLIILIFMLLQMSSASYLLFILSYFLIEIFSIFYLIIVELNKGFFPLPKINRAFELLNIIKERIVSNLSQAINIYGLVVFISYSFGPSIAAFIKIIERASYMVQLPAISSNQMLVKNVNEAISNNLRHNYVKIFANASKYIFIYQFMLLLIIITLMHFLVGSNVIENTSFYESYEFIIIISSGYLIATVMKWPFLRASLIGNTNDMLRASLLSILVQIIFGLYIFFNQASLIILLLLYPIGIVTSNLMLALYTKQAESSLWK
jgi:O-antigen/teichoic acid export membrane protein